MDSDFMQRVTDVFLAYRLKDFFGYTAIENPVKSMDARFSGNKFILTGM